MTMQRMNKIKWVVAAIALLAVGASGGYWWAHRTMRPASVAVDARDDSAPAGAAADKRRILYWHDPMVPNAKFDKPGKSPFMDMQLVPVYADEADGDGDVRVNANAVQNLGIRLGKVEKATRPMHLQAVGNVVFDERLVELVQARVEGYVTRLYVKAPLERVRRGQPLAAILAPQWLEAQQEYLALIDARSAGAQSIREAARQRLEILGVPEATIRAVETKRATDASTTLSAPIDGIVTELGVREGAAFMPGAALFRINGLRTVWVNAQIPEANVSMIPAGSAAQVRATAWPGATFAGRVIALLPDVDRETRTLTARIAVENAEFKLSPGMYVSLDFTGPAGEPQLLVPSEAVITTGERSVVIVAREDGAFDVVNVSVGTEQDGQSTILSGLTEGQAIVVSGQFLIDSEASLRSAMTRLEAAPTVVAGAVSVPAAVGSAGSEASRAQHLTQGVVTAITPEAITIAHEAVPSLQWPPMTMGFKPPVHGMPGNLKVGDHVSFSFSAHAGGSFQIDAISVLDSTERQP